MKLGIHDISQEPLDEKKVPGPWFDQFENGLKLNALGIDRKSHQASRWGILSKMVNNHSPLFDIYLAFDDRLKGVFELNRRSAICEDNYKRFRARVKTLYSQRENWRAGDYIPCCPTGFGYNSEKLGLRSAQLEEREKERPLGMFRSESVLKHMSLAAFREVEKTLYMTGEWPDRLDPASVGPVRNEKSAWEAHVL